MHTQLLKLLELSTVNFPVGSKVIVVTFFFFVSFFFIIIPIFVILFSLV